MRGCGCGCVCFFVCMNIRDENFGAFFGGEEMSGIIGDIFERGLMDGKDGRRRDEKKT